MQKFIAFGFIVTNTVFLLSFSPVIAQTNQNTGETASCTAALKAARSQIAKGKKVQITGIKKTNTPQRYQNYPQNRPNGYLFLIKGADAQSILLSKTFLPLVSANIIKSCKSVSIVEYKLDEPTEFITTTGLIGKSRVDVFTQCIDSNTQSQPNTKYPWGYVDCI